MVAKMTDSAATPALVEVLKLTAAKRCSADMLSAGIQAVAPKMGHSDNGLEPERKAVLVSLFVRNLRGLPVTDAAQLEHELLTAVGALPGARKTLEIRDALSLVGLRNYVRYLTVAINLNWANGMQTQSALSELARLIQEAGGGKFEIHTDLSVRAITVLATCKHAMQLAPALQTWANSLPGCVRARLDAHGLCELTISAAPQSH
jgi:hypothetical protein